MRRLIIFRHGKAVPHDAAPDFERGLTARGHSESEAMGAYLHAEQIMPDLALVSPAVRTRETWDEAAKSLGNVPLRLVREIYLASSDQVLRLLNGIEDSVMTVLIVGHNPSLHDLAIDLVSFGDRYAFARLREHLPPSGVVILDCPVDHWSELGVRTARLDQFRTPERAL